MRLADIPWRWPTAAIATLMTLSMSPMAEPFDVNPPVAMTRPVFAEPLTGRPVEQYRVSLPMDAGAALELTIPDDCAQVRKHLEAGRADRSRVVSRRLWSKTESDCRYFSLLNRHQAPDLVDHLRGYDFYRLGLRDLPVDIVCDDRPGSLCTRADPAPAGSRPLFPVFDEKPAIRTDRPQERCCSLRAGLLRARIGVYEGQLFCVPGQGNRIRMLGVDFGDIDGDGIRDAVLRMSFVLAGERRRVVRIPVTRLEADGPLVLVGAGSPGDATIR
jgi:hypothetical protein